MWNAAESIHAIWPITNEVLISFLTYILQHRVKTLSNEVHLDFFMCVLARVQLATSVICWNNTASMKENFACVSKALRYLQSRSV